jgi:hypothetical protein
MKIQSFRKNLKIQNVRCILIRKFEKSKKIAEHENPSIWKLYQIDWKRKKINNRKNQRFIKKIRISKKRIEKVSRNN